MTLAMTSKHRLTRAATLAVTLAAVSAVAALSAVAACSDNHTKPQVTDGSFATPTVSAPGSVLATGDNGAGQLGRPPSTLGSAGLLPVGGSGGRGQLDHVRALAGGGRHSLAVRDDGSLLAWGANDFGQLGNGSRQPSRYPAPVVAADGEPGVLRDVIAVAADTNFSLALLRNGHVVSFGAGNFGQRGNGSTAAPLTPTTVLDSEGTGPLEDVAAIAADGSTELALLRDGTVVAWGANNHGQLGDGTTNDRGLPAPVRGVDGEGGLSGVAGVAVGGQYALARTTAGSVLSWGANDKGQLGDGTTKPHRFPAAVRGINGVGLLTGATQVSAAEKHAFARLGSGRVVGWGFGGAGQLGNAAIEDRSTPSFVLDTTGRGPLGHVARVVAGEAYGVAILDDGTALDWGAAGAGQLGSGDIRDRSVPGLLLYGGGPFRFRVGAVGAGVRHLLLSADPSGPDNRPIPLILSTQVAAEAGGSVSGEYDARGPRV